MDNQRIQHHGAALYRALAQREPIAPLTSQDPDITIDDAYRIQMVMIEQRIAATGERIVGKKIGVTSRAVMNMLGVYQPDFGHLLSGMIVSDGSSIDSKTLIQPKAEGEIAFLLKKDLIGPGISNADVLAATECVMPCFEIVDSRIPRLEDQDSGHRRRQRLVRCLCARRSRGRSAPHRPHHLRMVLEKNGDIVATVPGRLPSDRPSMPWPGSPTRWDGSASGSRPAR